MHLNVPNRELVIASLRAEATGYTRVVGILGPNLCRSDVGEVGPTNLEAVLGKPGVRLFAWMREVPEPVPAPGVAGAILTRAAFKSSREMYASAPRMVATNDCICAGKGRGASLSVHVSLFCILNRAHGYDELHSFDGVLSDWQ